jgi:hypothetical protein
LTKPQEDGKRSAEKQQNLFIDLVSSSGKIPEFISKTTKSI